MLKLTSKKKKWFIIEQDSSGETQVEIVHLKPGEVADIEAKTNQIIGKQYGDDFHTEIDFKLNERGKTYVLRAITDWKGFVGLNDKPLTCNETSKLKVINEYDWFIDAIEKFREELAEEVEADEEDAEKN